ncbi:pseudouridine synthase [Tabrizicola sp. YIM 78059]|uniref:pseudouridine synthase n=1 Tax=Tabrizicola sp. YIM 78059 TaxID=2529861 RepID=UPI0010A9C39C|nr:pseudouridine synthase [Tabrizicola sp. YIM 78059]
MAPKDKQSPDPKPEGERIAKVLSRAGIASRREAERLIELGEVRVNGKVITSPALNVTAKDRITVRGEPVGQPEPPRLWLYYKPEGLVTSAADEKGRDTVFDHLPEDMPRVMSIGRLDINSEGLLLLTNDGELKRRLELPSTGWLRKYRVRVKGNPTDPDLEPLRKGVTIDGERFQPMEVRLDRHQGANAWLTVGLREGKNREIRRAMAHIGLTVNRLIRISYGPFRLGELQPGEVEEVKPRVLRDQLGLAETPETPRPATRTTRPAAKPAEGSSGKTRTRTPPKTAAEAQTRSGRTPLKPGSGLKQLSETWQQATRPPGRKTNDRPPSERAAKPRPIPPKPGPRTGGPKKG